MWICSNCGMANEDAFDVCPACAAGTSQAGERAHDASPTPLPDSPRSVDAESFVDGRASQSAGDLLVLEEVRTRTEIEIGGSGGFLGREGDYKNDLFSPKVSRLHLEVRKEQAGWSITPMNTVNSTYVYKNGESAELVEGVPHPLYGGETVRMADMTFRVSLKSGAEGEEGVSEVSPEAAREESLPASAEEPQAIRDDGQIEGWFIDCPPGGCGWSFQVAGEAAHLSECPRCADAFDKRKIAQVKPCYGKRDRRVVDDVR
ncbi:FHA domain-containing protein [Arabiibacter massiliensis]|uniref:FHA domain-containing protein n=1 Tax=Arabiibacter massiliensis TaxID=1870985 RepID=UPI0009B942D2|nr:FHA domain-containing protein [Arabiibacter massiliensis]